MLPKKHKSMLKKEKKENKNFNPENRKRVRCIGFFQHQEMPKSIKIRGKKCRRSTMLQERLNGLAMCSIEKDILDIIDLESVLEDFASRNARRRFLKKH